MKNKAGKIMTVVALGVALCICARSTLATTITTADYGIGTIIPGTPASPSAELGYVQTSVSIWNGTTAAGTYAGNTFTLLSGGLVPTPVTAPSAIPSNEADFSGSGNTATLSLGTGGYEYLLTRWGGGDILFYVEGLTGDVTIENDLVSPGQTDTGMSHYALFSDGSTPPNVPDGGSTLAMLGSALLAISGFSRKAIRA